MFLLIFKYAILNIKQIYNYCQKLDIIFAKDRNRHHCDKETGIIINPKVETLVHRHLYLKS